MRRNMLILLVLLMGAILSACGEVETSGTNSDPVPSSNSPSQSPSEDKNKPTISKAEFDEIKNGMTYDEVVAIIGSEGEVMSEVGTEGEDLHTIMYMWEGESLGANANFTFQEGKLTMKAQFGLE